MVRHRSLVASTFGRLLLVAASVLTPAAYSQSTRPEKTDAPIDRQPYRIRLLLATGPQARIDRLGREQLIEQWLTLVRRFVGAPWQVEVGPEETAAPLVLSSALETAVPASAEAQAKAGAFDKVWLVRVDASGPGLSFTGREYDAATRRLGPLQRLEAPVRRDAPRDFFRFTLDLFAPYAVIGERFAADVELTVRGGSLVPASPLGRVVSEGTVFQPFRVVPRPDGPPLLREVPYTYLRVESARPPGARCSFVSVYSDPFTDRVVQKTTLVALGVRPGRSATRLRFVTLPDRAPAAGYVLTARAYPDGSPRELGLTDRQGRVALAPGSADGLVIVRLLAGSAEPMIEFPLVPGVDGAEIDVPAFDPRPLTVTLETRLDSLRDAIIDLVAVRARLLARLKARFDGEDWAEAAQTLKEYATLTPTETFATELARLKDEAARQQAQTRAAVLTKTAQARLAEVQALIERYLDDEEFKAYADALDKLRSAPPRKAAPPAPAPRPAAPPDPVVAPPPSGEAAPATAEKPAPAPTPKPASGSSVPF